MGWDGSLGSSAWGFLTTVPSFLSLPSPIILALSSFSLGNLGYGRTPQEEAALPGVEDVGRQMRWGRTWLCSHGNSSQGFPPAAASAGVALHPPLHPPPQTLDSMKLSLN